MAPPLTSTSPLGSKVAFDQCLLEFIGAALDTTGLPLVTSTIVAALLPIVWVSVKLSNAPPPTWRILPGAYITAVELAPQLDPENVPALSI